MIKIVKFTLVDKGALKGFFDLEIPAWHMTIFSCQYFEKGNQKWIGLPSRKIEKENEKPSYLPFIRFDQEVKARLEAACIEAIKTHLNGPSDDFRDMDQSLF